MLPSDMPVHYSVVTLCKTKPAPHPCRLRCDNNPGPAALNTRLLEQRAGLAPQRTALWGWDATDVDWCISLAVAVARWLVPLGAMGLNRRGTKDEFSSTS